MSLQAKATAAKEIVTSFSKWSDIPKVYASFRDARIQFYSQDQPSKLPPVQTLHLRNSAVQALGSDANALKFPVSDALMHPDGNGGYYTMIMKEAMMKNEKQSTVTAIKETTFGWFK